MQMSLAPQSLAMQRVLQQQALQTQVQNVGFQNRMQHPRCCSQMCAWHGVYVVGWGMAVQTLG